MCGTTRLTSARASLAGCLLLVLLLPAAAGALTGKGESAPGTLDSSPPVVAVTYPAGGEIFQAGDTETLTWTIAEDLFDPAPPPILVQVFDGATEIWSDLVAPDPSGNYSYPWVVEDLYTTDATLKVSATDHFGLAGEAVSAVFTIHSSLTGADTPALPRANRLEPCFPNPFNPRTSLRFALRATATIELAIYDLGGRRVATLAAGEWNAGTHSVVWHGVDRTGQPASSGVYLARLRIDGENPETLVQRVTLLK